MISFVVDIVIAEDKGKMKTKYANTGFTIIYLIYVILSCFYFSFNISPATMSTMYLVMRSGNV